MTKLLNNIWTEKFGEPAAIRNIFTTGPNTPSFWVIFGTDEKPDIAICGTVYGLPTLRSPKSGVIQWMYPFTVLIASEEAKQLLAATGVKQLLALIKLTLTRFGKFEAESPEFVLISQEKQPDGKNIYTRMQGNDTVLDGVVYVAADPGAVGAWLNITMEIVKPFAQRQTAEFPPESQPQPPMVH